MEEELHTCNSKKKPHSLCVRWMNEWVNEKLEVIGHKKWINALRPVSFSKLKRCLKKCTILNFWLKIFLVSVIICAKRLKSLKDRDCADL